MQSLLMNPLFKSLFVPIVYSYSIDSNDNKGSVTAVVVKDIVHALVIWTFVASHEYHVGYPFRNRTELSLFWNRYDEL